MVKVLFGSKGMGKTKILIDKANGMAQENSNAVVYIDDSNDRLYDLKHEVRFINVCEYPVDGMDAFFGFLCGIASANYDINMIIIDGLNYFIKQEINAMKRFFVNLEGLSNQHSIDFFISINGDTEQMPEYLKEYSISL